MAEYHYSNKTAPDRRNKLCPAELRFIEALNTLKAQHAITIKGFADELGIAHSTITEFRDGKRNRKARVEWLELICSYGISAEWLLTGRGSMMQ